MRTLFSIVVAVIAMLAVTAALAQPPNKGKYSFSVKKEGTGPALVLIPGLYCSGDVWQETVAHFRDHYTCYSLTLPGFAGQPPLGGEDILARVSGEIARFVSEEGIKKPILVGHSLGGWLALKVEADHPGLAGGIVCVSSAPFLPALAMGSDVTLDSARRIGLVIKKYMSSETPEQTKAAQQATLKFMIRDSANIEKVLPMAVRSDPATQGEVMYELFSSDLRNAMSEVRCPVLVLGDWMSYKTYGATRENTIEKYQDQFAKAPHVAISLSDSARHFIMYDEPGWFYAQLEPFLASGHNAP